MKTQRSLVVAALCAALAIPAAAQSSPGAGAGDQNNTGQPEPSRPETRPGDARPAGGRTAVEPAPVGSDPGRPRYEAAENERPGGRARRRWWWQKDDDRTREPAGSTREPGSGGSSPTGSQRSGSGGDITR